MTLPTLPFADLDPALTEFALAAEPGPDGPWNLVPFAFRPSPVPVILGRVAPLALVLPRLRFGIVRGGAAPPVAGLPPSLPWLNAAFLLPWEAFGQAPPQWSEVWRTHGIDPQGGGASALVELLALPSPLGPSYLHLLLQRACRLERSA